MMLKQSHGTDQHNQINYSDATRKSLFSVLATCIMVANKFFDLRKLHIKQYLLSSASDISQQTFRLFRIFLVKVLEIIILYIS